MAKRSKAAAAPSIQSCCDWLAGSLPGTIYSGNTYDAAGQLLRIRAALEAGDVNQAVRWAFILGLCNGTQRARDAGWENAMRWVARRTGSRRRTKLDNSDKARKALAEIRRRRPGMKPAEEKRALAKAMGFNSARQAGRYIEAIDAEPK